jgi:hypothetical protein
VVIDCLRLDQWRALRPLLGHDFDIEESLYSSILPTATPYSRNAIFSGQFPDEIAADRPEWWEIDEGSLNAFEDDLLREQLERLTGRDVPVHYEKVFTDEGGDDLVRGCAVRCRRAHVAAVVFNFVDLLTHGRSESAIADGGGPRRGGAAVADQQWFERSSARRVLQEAAAAGVTTVLTSDHGSILCERPLTVYADATPRATFATSSARTCVRRTESGVFAR